jgi:hypothetical protein
MIRPREWRMQARRALMDGKALNLPAFTVTVQPGGDLRLSAAAAA